MTLKKNMSKTNCTIIKDLLPSYIDGICSSESCKLVQEHMAECSACRKIYEQTQLELTSATSHPNKKIDFLKQVKKNVIRKNSVICAIVSLLLLFQMYVNSNTYYFTIDLFEYIHYLLPVFVAGMLFVLLPDYAEHKVPAKPRFTILGIELACMTYILILLLYTGQSILNGSRPFHLELHDIGPFLNIQIMVLAVLFLLVFALTLFFSIRHRQICPAMHFVPLGGFSLMLEYQRLLGELSSRFELSYFVRPYLILSVEIIVLIVVYMIANRKKIY